MRSHPRWRGLCTLTKRKHETKCYEECCSNKKESLRSCFCFCHFFHGYSWRRSHWRRSDYRSCRSIEFIGSTLIGGFCSTFCRCLDIGHVRDDRESEHSDHLTIFLISFFESISSIEISFYKFYLLSWREDKWWTWSCSCCPLNIARVLPYVCFWSGARRPGSISEFYHVWSFLLIFIGSEWARTCVGPVIEDSRESYTRLYSSSVITESTVIDRERRAWVTVHCFVFTECWSSRWRDGRCCREGYRRSIHYSSSCSRCSWCSSTKSISSKERWSWSYRHKSDYAERKGSHRRGKIRNKYTWT